MNYDMGDFFAAKWAKENECQHIDICSSCCKAETIHDNGRGEGICCDCENKCTFLCLNCGKDEVA